MSDGYHNNGLGRLGAPLQDLAIASADGQTMEQVLLMAYAGLDFRFIGFGPNVGYLFRGQREMPVFGATMRLGANDGLYAQVRAGAGIEAVPIPQPVGAPPVPD
jgi:hypothetical protein